MPNSSRMCLATHPHLFWKAPEMILLCGSLRPTGIRKWANEPRKQVWITSSIFRYCRRPVWREPDKQSWSLAWSPRFSEQLYKTFWSLPPRDFSALSQAWPQIDSTDFPKVHWEMWQVLGAWELRASAVQGWPSNWLTETREGQGNSYS